MLYLHATPSSAVEAFWQDAAAERRDVRLLAVDRPANGASTRTRAEVTARVCAEIAEALALERFGVSGFSGGAGHSLAVAAICGDRVTRVQVGGGMGSLADASTEDVPRSRRLQMRLIASGGPLSRGLLRHMSSKRRRVLEVKLVVPMYAGLEMPVGAAAGAQLVAAVVVRTRRRACAGRSVARNGGHRRPDRDRAPHGGHAARRERARAARRGALRLPDARR